MVDCLFEAQNSLYPVNSCFTQIF